MKKLLILVAILMLMASSAYATAVETEQGVKEFTVAWIKGAVTAPTSGAVCILNTGQTTAPTEYGQEITATTTVGQPIYGIYADRTLSTAELINGAWVRVQTRGYNSSIQKNAGDPVTLSSTIYTGSTAWKAGCSASVVITQQAIAYETAASGAASTFKGYLF